MARKGGGKKRVKPKKSAKIAIKTSKKPKKPARIQIKTKKSVKHASKAVIASKAIINTTPSPQITEEHRILKKLPPAKPEKIDTQVCRIFGHNVDPRKIRESAMEAYNKRCYSIDDINVEFFIRDKEWDNLITKIGILDRIEEQLVLLYPHIDVVRKDKTSLELYVK
ncbi:MAG: hypothetical protein PHG85_03620 [Candidatus Altiarchaeota archaeon]|nr:hypothetical protein [Candidatus Altiarchaeota archaeon]